MQRPTVWIPSIISLLAFLAITTILTGYARWILGYPICGTDEQNYLNIFNWLDRGGVWPISGPGYAGLILTLRDWTGCALRPLVVAVATLNSSVILPLGLWLFYCVSLNGIRSAWLCLPWLFASSYFLGPWLEGRPQQLGMLLVIASAWRAYQDLQNYGRCGIGFFALWLLCFGYHALSFVILTTLVFGFWAWRFVQGHSGYRALVALLLGLAGCLALGILWYPLIWLDIRINHIHGAHASEFFGVLILGTVTGLLLLHGLRRCPVNPRLVCCLRVGLASRRLYGFMAGSIAVALIWQYSWLGHLYRGINPSNIIWYQGGNLLIACLFLLGVWRLAQHLIPSLVFFLESCVILMILGGLFLLLTPWLRDQNWTLRILGYWTWYAAPLAAYGWSGLPERWRLGLLLVVPILLVGGLYHVVDAPTWTCRANG